MKSIQSRLWTFVNKNINLFATIGALLASLLLAMLLLALVGVNPIQAVAKLTTSFIHSKYMVGEVFVYGCPFLLAGLGIGLALKANYWNLGAEGQLWWGALFAALPGIYITGLPPWLHLPLVLVCAILGGVFWSLPPLILKLKFGVNEILSNLLLNPVALLFMNYLLWGPLKDPAREQPQTLPMQEGILFGKAIAGTRTHYGILFGFAAVILVYIIVNHSVWGFEIRSIGNNLQSARYNGINVNRVILKAGAFAGGLAGLAGGIWILSVQAQLMEGTFPGYGFSGYGFTAIPVALLGQLNPIGIFFSSLLFGLLEAMGHAMQVQIGVSKFFVGILAGLIVLFVLFSSYITWKARRSNV